MIIKGYRYLNDKMFPLCVDSLKLTGVRPYCGSYHYSAPHDHEYQIYIELYSGSKIMELQSFDSIVINGVEIVNGSTENALKITEYLTMVMQLEQHENDKAESK